MTSTRAARASLALGALAVLMLHASSAGAQSDQWLFLPTVVEGNVQWMLPSGTRVNRELRRQGVGVWSSDAALTAFRERGSRTAPLISEGDVDTWRTSSQQALRGLALGDYDSALSELEKAQDFARAALVALNRDESGAHAVLDTCLYLVRALVQTGDQAGAETQARECVRNSLGVAPTRRMHPPTIVDLYEAAANAARVGTLLVESEPSGCALRVGGVRVGDTPHELTGLYPGSYQVQVECEPGRPARVHAVEVRGEGTSLFVFDELDRSVRTSPLLHLQYDDPPEPLLLARDARELGRTLPASVVLAASFSTEEVLELRVVAGADPVFVRLAAPGGRPSTSDAASAAAALLAGECKDLTGSAAVAIDCQTGAPIAIASDGGTRRPRPPRGQYIAGVTLASAGTASLLASYGLLIARRPAGDDWISSPNSLSAQDKWLGLGTGVIVTSSIGGGLLVAAMPLSLPYAAKTPWWAWMSGGLGVAAAAVSIASAVTASPKAPQSCRANGPDPTPCVNRARDTDRAIVLGATAAPLLTIPLVYLLRKGEKRLDASLSPTIAVTRSGGSFGVRGEF